MCRPLRAASRGRGSCHQHTGDVPLMRAMHGRCIMVMAMCSVVGGLWRFLCPVAVLRPASSGGGGGGGAPLHQLLGPGNTETASQATRATGAVSK